MFLLGSVTFSKLFKVYYLYACLVITVLQINTMFINPLRYTLRSVFLWRLVGAYLAGLLYFQDSVNSYEYISILQRSKAF